MKLDHLIFTRFSLTDVFPGVKNDIDPLAPEFLAIRDGLLRMVCLPSVLSQTGQDFAWIILIDADLPASWRATIDEIAGSRERTHVVEYRGNKTAAETTWLKHLVLPETEYLITTILDDDDSLPTGYVEAVRNRVIEFGNEPQPPAAIILAAREIIQWDLLFSSSTPYGFRCPWHRPEAQASSCGFSLACKFPEISMSVLGLKHRMAFDYLAVGEPAGHRLVTAFRRKLLRQCRSAPRHPIVDAPRFENVDMSRLIGPVLMTNHSQNAEQSRLFEQKAAYEPVSGRETFDGFSIDWDAVDEHSSFFRVDDVG